MRTVVFSTTVIAGVVWIGIAPSNAAPPSMSGIGNTNIEVATVKNVGYRRRYYRQYGYPVPYAYYPPAYGHYVPPAAYVYPPAIAYVPRPEGDYGGAPPLEGDYGDYGGAPPPEGDYGDYGDAPPLEGDYGDAPTLEGDYGDAPTPEGY